MLCAKFDGNLLTF